MKQISHYVWIVIILATAHCQHRDPPRTALNSDDNSCYDLRPGLISLEPLKFETLSGLNIYSKEDRLNSFVGYPCNVTMYNEYEQRFQRHLYTCPFQNDLELEFETYKMNTIKNNSIHFQAICFSNQYEKCVPRINAKNNWCDGICQCIENMEIAYPKGLDTPRHKAIQLLEHHKLCGVHEGGTCVPAWKHYHNITFNFRTNTPLTTRLRCKSNGTVENKYKRWINDMMLPCERNAMCRLDKKVCECALGYRCKHTSQGNILTIEPLIVLLSVLYGGFNNIVKILILISTLPSAYSQKLDGPEERYIDPSCLPRPGLLSLEPLQYKHLSQVKIYSKEDRLNSFVGYPCNTTLYNEYYEKFQRHLYTCPFDQDLEHSFQIYKRGTIRQLDIHFQAICFSNQFEECYPHPDNKSGEWCDGICRCIPELEIEFPEGIDPDEMNITSAMQIEEQGKLCGVQAGGVCVPAYMDEKYSLREDKICNTSWSMRPSHELSMKDFFLPCEWNAMCRKEKKVCECAIGYGCNGASRISLDKLVNLLLISFTLFGIS